MSSMIFSVERRRRRTRILAVLLPFVLVGVAGGLSACAEPQVMRETLPPSSLPPRNYGVVAATALIPEPERHVYQLSTSNVFINGAGPAAGPARRRLGDRILGKVAREIGKMRRHSLDDPFAHYRVNFMRYQDNFQSAEDSAGTLGIDKASFRQGIVIATAASAVALGALNLIKPEGLTDELFRTRFRIGYDVSHLDDPKLFFTYKNLFRIGGDRDGLYGAFRDKSGRLYSGEVNVFKRRAVVTLIF
jgi:hypothetical protein